MAGIDDFGFSGRPSQVFIVYRINHTMRCSCAN